MKPSIHGCCTLLFSCCKGNSFTSEMIPKRVRMLLSVLTCSRSQHPGHKSGECVSWREIPGGRRFSPPAQWDANRHYLGHPQVSSYLYHCIHGYQVESLVRPYSWISTGPTISVVRETVSVSNEFFDKVCVDWNIVSSWVTCCLSGLSRSCVSSARWPWKHCSQFVILLK